MLNHLKEGGARQLAMGVSRQNWLFLPISNRLQDQKGGIFKHIWDHFEISACSILWSVGGTENNQNC